MHGDIRRTYKVQTRNEQLNNKTGEKFQISRNQHNGSQ